MQLAVFNENKVELPGCCPDGHLIQVISHYLSELFGERDVIRHPYQSPPAAFETSDLYDHATGGHNND